MKKIKIADVLNDDGIKTRLDKNWTATGVKNVVDKNWEERGQVFTGCPRTNNTNT